MKFGFSIGIFLNSAHLICRSTDISKRFGGSLRLRDNESRLYVNYTTQQVDKTYPSKWGAGLVVLYGVNMKENEKNSSYLQF